VIQAKQLIGIVVRDTTSWRPPTPIKVYVLTKHEESS
jgi:hypothetical protein